MIVRHGKVIALTSFVFLLGACGNETIPSTTKTTTTKSDSIFTNDINELSLGDGFNLMESNCFSCHHPGNSSENKIAPSMAEVKLAYKNTYADRETFVANFSAFLQNPTKENALMPEAISNYGMMPLLGYSESQLNAIAEYLYGSNIEKEGWYENDYPVEKEKYAALKKDRTPLEIGQEIAMETKGVLGKNLKNAIKTRGTENAVEFCSTQAISLTDSMVLVLNAKIKRVSDLNRNPNNAANESELNYILAAKRTLANGEEIQPSIQIIAGKQVGYYPILTNDMCLQCHGNQNSDISISTAERIKQLYPNDKAIGYGANELRGIWVIEMNN